MSNDTREVGAEQNPHEEEALGRAYDGRLLLRLWPYVRPYRAQVTATILIFFPIFLLAAADSLAARPGRGAPGFGRAP